MGKAQITMDKIVYLGLFLLDLSKIVTYELWHDYLKPKFGENAKLCFMNTGGFIVHVKSYDVHKDIAEDVGRRFVTPNYDIDRPLPLGVNVIRL